MAAKKLFDDDDDSGDGDQPKQKKIKMTASFASVIGEVVKVRATENFFSKLEPILRKTVREEIEDALRRHCMDPLSRNLSIVPVESAPSDRHSGSLKLAFTERLSLSIFTGTKILDVNGNPLQIAVQEADGSLACLPQIVKAEILVLDGDFSGGDSDEFAKNVLKERTGRRPLISGECSVTLSNGVGCVGIVEFTDNSSWIRSRKFRLGARVVKTPGLGILEAITEPFVVKDHRGEVYRKHYPPELKDEVWRLEKIGKGGALHRKLAEAGIDTVQDFLKLFHIDSFRLRMIMGSPSEKMWKLTLDHAKTCVLGTKLYRLHRNNHILTISPTCQVLQIEDANGQIYSEKDLKRSFQMDYIQSLTKDAYSNWNQLEEVDDPAPLPTPPQLTYKGETRWDAYGLDEQRIALNQAHLSDGSFETSSGGHDYPEDEVNFSALCDYFKNT